MNWLEKWRAIGARIEGIIEASKFVSSISGTDDYSSIQKSIFPEIDTTCTELKIFHESFEHILPPSAAEVLKDWLHSITIVREAHNPIASLKASIASLITLRSRFTYLIQDTEVSAKSRTERAFEHLRRQIAVDEAFQEKWQNAYNTRETKCEKLGAVHLLSHGIWAFKAQGIKGATDLIYAEQSLDETLINQIAASTVLTEWKCVTPQDAHQKSNEAIAQIKDYSGGLLGDMALKNTRYIVLVSEPQLQAIQDRKVGEITYRHINIPVKPLVPSKAARRLTQ